jgi:CRISPR-associated protein (TIGR03986 family)
MAVNEKHVERAIVDLQAKFGPQSKVADAVEFLTGFPVFDCMDEEDIEQIAREALKRLGSAPQPGTGPRPGPRPGPMPVGRRRRGTTDATPMAPFRFVELPDDVAMPLDGETPSLCVPRAGGVSAKIEVEWVAETPLLIGEEKSGVIEPLTLAGDYVIPGATFRGLIRAGLEIVAHGRLGAANLHHRYGLRDFDHPAYAERAPVTRVGEVNAGWLVKIPDPADDKKKIWAIAPLGNRWDHVLIDNMRGRAGMADRESWIKKSLLDKYALAGMRRNDGKIDFTRTQKFGTRTSDAFGRRLTIPGGTNDGVLVFSGKLPGSNGNKKYEYVFYGNGGAPVPLTPAAVRLFKLLHCKPSKNKEAPDGSWRDLVDTFEAGLRIPVFYVGDLAAQGRDFAFGLTRLFKVPHERSVGDVLAAQPAHRVKPEAIAGGAYPADFVENLFGFVVEPDEIGLGEGDRAATDSVARKGRISFGFGWPVAGGKPTLSKEIRAVMMAPRASYAPFYLRSGAEKDYSAVQSPKLAGRKRYLPRRTDKESLADILAWIETMGQRQIRMIEEQSRRPVSPDVLTRLQFLVPMQGTSELRFRSEIRLHNVSAEELGAVLFVVTHGGDPAKPYRHMIGRARPFGAGQIRVASARLMVTPNDAAAAVLVRPPEERELADAVGRTGFCPAGDGGTSASHLPFVDAFIASMKARGGRLAPFPKVPAVQEWLGTSDPRLTPKREEFDYMGLKPFAAIRKEVKPVKSGEAPSQEYSADRLLKTPKVDGFWR